MGNTATVIGFNGMSNLESLPAKFKDQEGLGIPAIVLNADIRGDGIVQKRRGYRRKISLSNCHSLWGGNSLTLCIADGADGAPSLFRVEGGAATEICSVGNFRAKFWYESFADRIYLSNGYWKGVYYSSGTVTSWGLDIPDAPRAAVVSGGKLPPGRYSLCYTQRDLNDGTRIGGNGPVAQLSWEGEQMGIQLTGMPSDCYCWITQANGSEFFLANPAGGLITDMFPDTVPLPTLGVREVPNLINPVVAFSRMWGAVGNRVHYSLPYQFEHFIPSDAFLMEETVNSICPVNSGIYVNSANHTWFLDGREPRKMKRDRLGDGAIPGSVAQAMIESGGYEVSKKLTQMPSPVWIGKRGLVVGTDTGHLVHLSEDKIKMYPRAAGAAVVRNQGGENQIMITLRGNILSKEQDAEINNILAINRLFVPGPLKITAHGGLNMQGEGEVTNG